MAGSTTTSCRIEGSSIDVMVEEERSPPPEIKVQMDANLPPWFQHFVGVAEEAAAVGLILPGITRVQPFLVTWAAAGISSSPRFGR